MSVRVLRWVQQTLSVLFWVLILFGSDTPRMATYTLAAVAVHEAGHLLVLFLLTGKSGDFRPRTVGFTLTPRRLLSYREQFLLAAAGPAANLLFAGACLPAAVAGGRTAFGEIATVSLLTALSNLLPIRGYDGEGMLLCALALRLPAHTAAIVAEAVSLFFVSLSAFLSLFFLLRAGFGHWQSVFFLLSLVCSVKT